MQYVGPCYLCGETLGEFEKRVYVGNGRKAHPTCWATKTGTGYIVISTDAPWDLTATNVTYEEMQATQNIIDDPFLPTQSELDKATTDIHIRRLQADQNLNRIPLKKRSHHKKKPAQDHTMEI